MNKIYDCGIFALLVLAFVPALLVLFHWVEKVDVRTGNPKLAALVVLIGVFLLISIESAIFYGIVK